MKILRKFRYVIDSFLVIVLKIYDKFMSFFRKQFIKSLDNHDTYAKYPNQMKTEAVFREYFKTIEEKDTVTTDDIAAFYTAGPGKELVKKTSRVKKNKDKIEEVSNTTSAKVLKGKDLLEII